MITARFNQRQVNVIHQTIDEIQYVTSLADDLLDSPVSDLESDIKRRSAPHRRTGQMQQAIGSRKIATGGYGVGFYNTHFGPLGLEFGTRYQQAQPILVPAFDDHVDRIAEQFERDLESRLP